jgi:CO dehydrogenase nickel-insertion accessory protein CooC1
LNRRIASQVDTIFEILDYSKKAFEHVKRAHRIIDELRISYSNFYLVGGHDVPDSFLKIAQQETGVQFIGTISYDDMLREYVAQGRSLLDLPFSSPAYVSIQEILTPLAGRAHA